MNRPERYGFTFDNERSKADHFRRTGEIGGLSCIFEFDQGCIFQWSDYFAWGHMIPAFINGLSSETAGRAQLFDDLFAVKTDAKC